MGIEVRNLGRFASLSLMNTSSGERLDKRWFRCDSGSRTE
jgi:hypothetical protein